MINDANAKLDDVLALAPGIVEENITALAIISHAYPDPRERTAAVGIWAGVGGLALAVGPLLGGLLSQHASWPWIFEINVPIGVATMALGAWAISESRDAGRKRLDVPGLVVSAVALTTLTWALIEGSGRGWTSPSILAAFVVAAAAGIDLQVADTVNQQCPAHCQPGAAIDGEMYAVNSVTDGQVTGGRDQCAVMQRNIAADRRQPGQRAVARCRVAGGEEAIRSVDGQVGAERRRCDLAP